MESQKNKITEEFENAEVESEKETETPLETEEIKEITAEKKTSFLKRFLNSFKKNWKKIVIISGAVILISALIFGGIFLSNSIKANKIEEQLKGMVFKHYNEFDSGSVTNWTLDVIDIKEDGTYIMEDWSCYPMDDDPFSHSKYEHDLDVRISFTGKAWLGNYEIIFDEDGEVESLDLGGLVRYEAVDEESSDSIISSKVVEVFGKLTKWKNGNFEKMVTTIYKDYDIYCDAVEGSDTKYLITIEGQYYPNKTHLKNYTEKGTFSVEVDLETQEGEIIKDQGITSAYETYLALSTTWW